MAGPSYQSIRARRTLQSSSTKEGKAKGTKKACKQPSHDSSVLEEAIVSPSAMRQLLESYTAGLLAIGGGEASAQRGQAAMDLARTLQHALKRDLASPPAGVHAGPIKHMWERLSAGGALSVSASMMVNGLIDDSNAFATSLKELDRRLNFLESMVCIGDLGPALGEAPARKSRHNSSKGANTSSPSNKVKIRKGPASQPARVEVVATANDSEKASIIRLCTAAEKARQTLEQLNTDVRRLSTGQVPAVDVESLQMSSEGTAQQQQAEQYGPDSLLLHVQDMLHAVPHGEAPGAEASLWAAPAAGLPEQQADQTLPGLKTFNDFKLTLASLQDGQREQFAVMRAIQQDDEQFKAILPTALSALHALLADREAAQQAVAEQALATAELRSLVFQLQTAVQQSARLPGVVSELKSAVSDMQDSAIVLAAAVRELGQSISSMQQEHAALKQDLSQVPEMMGQLRDAANNMEHEIRAHLDSVELSVMHLAGKGSGEVTLDALQSCVAEDGLVQLLQQFSTRP